MGQWVDTDGPIITWSNNLHPLSRQGPIEDNWSLCSVKINEEVEDDV